MPRKLKTEWLDRRIAHPGPYLVLCLSQAEYDAALAHLEIRERDAWLNSPRADATTHHADNPQGARVCIVCLRAEAGRNPIEVAGLLVHEAVHVWQAYCRDIGEHAPGAEQEAYAIQSIAQELMAEYARRLQGE